MFNKDTFRLIQKTLKRFISLFLIVLIGVAFMVGLLSCHVVMRQSVDKYYDATKLFDLQIYSSYGFNDDDIAALSTADGVDVAFGSKFVDCYGLIKNRDSEMVTRIQEVNTPINKFELLEGRLPQKDNEVVVLGSGSFGGTLSIGTNFTVFLNNSDIEDKLSEIEFVVVGVAKTPQYMANTKETSTLDNKAIDIVVFAKNDIFLSEYYTTAFITLTDAESYTSFTKDYADFISENKVGSEMVALERDGVLKETIIADSEKEIDDGERELLDKKAEAQAEIDKGEAELEKAYFQLMMADATIETNRITIEQSEKKLADSKKLLDTNSKTVDKAIAQVEEETGMSFNEAYGQISTLYASYIAIESQIGTGNIDNTLQTQKENLIRQKNNNLTEIERLENENISLQNQINEIDLQLQTISDKESEQYIQLSQQKQDLSDNITTNNNIVSVLKASNDIIDNNITLIENGQQNDTDEMLRNALEEMDKQAGGSVKDTYNQLNALRNAKRDIDNGYIQLEDGLKQLNDGKKQLAEAEKEVKKNWAEYEKGVKKLEDGKKEFADEIEEAENKIAKTRQDLKELPDAKWTILDRDSHYSSYLYIANCDQMQAIGTYLPFLFFLVAALVCMTTMTRLIDEQRNQIGVFSALGFSKFKIISKYLIYALIASLSGSVVGIFVGCAIFPTVVYQCWKLMYDTPAMVFTIPLMNSVIGLFSFTILMLVITYLVCNKELKSVPSQLLRPKAPKTSKKAFIEKIGFIWNSLSFTSKITIRNIFRYKARFLMTVIGVAGCTGLLVIGFGVKDSITDVVNVQFTEVYKYTDYITLSDDDNVDEILTVTKDDIRNEEVVPFMTYNSKVYLPDGKDKAITVEVFNPREIKDVLDLRVRSSKDPINIAGTGIVISEKFANDNGYKIGDYITFESKNGIKATLRVDAICEWYINHYIFMSESLYKASFSEKIHYNNIAVTTTNPQQLINSVKNLDNVISIVNFDPMIESFTSMLQALNLIIILITGVAGALAFVVLINLTEVNISERIREIATLKVLGFLPKEVNSYISKEIFLLSLIGAIVGLPLGMFEHKFVMGTINMEMARFGDQVKPMSYLYSFLITIFFTIVVLLTTRKTLKQVDMIESLKSVE